jgi:hypothetical protein
VPDILNFFPLLKMASRTVGLAESGARINAAMDKAATHGLDFVYKGGAPRIPIQLIDNSLIGRGISTEQLNEITLGGRNSLYNFFNSFPPPLSPSVPSPFELQEYIERGVDNLIAYQVTAPRTFLPSVRQYPRASSPSRVSQRRLELEERVRILENLLRETQVELERLR